jgi:integrase
MEDKHQAFEIIRQARNTIKLWNNTSAEKTRTDYQKIFDRLFNANTTPIAHAKTKNSYYKYRAAWIYGLTKLLSQLLQDADKLQKTNEKEWLDIVEEISATIFLLADYPADPKHQSEVLGVKSLWTEKEAAIKKQGLVIKNKSKRKTIKRLPQDWRNVIFARALQKKSKYSDAIGTLSITGCRPAEIEKGVLFEINDGGLKVTISGAKTHNGKFGSPTRSFVISEDNLAFEHIHELCMERGGNFTVIGQAKAIGDSVSLLANDMKLNKVSAYSFRHQLSADLKAGGFGADDIAKVLGHCTDRSQTYYSSRSGKGGGRNISNIEGREPLMKNKMAFHALNNKDNDQTFTNEWY